MTTPPNAPEADALATIEDAAICLENWGEIHEARDLRAAVAALLTREAALVAEVDLLRRVQASMATEGVALVAERDALAAEVGALRNGVNGLKFDIYELALPELREAFDGAKTICVVQMDTVKALREALARPAAARSEAGHG